MNTLVVLAALLAAAVAEQIVAVNQDSLGNYNLQYNIDGIARVENRDLHGNVNGAYAYIDPYGILRKTEFTSGAHGFNAVGTDIPLPVQDTPEVAHAKAAHISILNAARASLPIAPLEEQFPELFAPRVVAAVHGFPASIGAPVHAFPASIPALPAFADHSVGFPAHPLAFGAGLHAGQVIPDTPEVVAARAQHFAAHAEALRLNGHIH